MKDFELFHSRKHETFDSALEVWPLTRRALIYLALGALGMLLVLPRLSVHAQGTSKTAKTASSQSGSVENGKKLFTSYGCYECHGREAQGGTGPRLGPDPVPLSIFQQYVRHPGGTMPPFTSKVASDQDLADIYAFVSSLPEPPKAKDIPLLNQ